MGRPQETTVAGRQSATLDRSITVEYVDRETGAITLGGPQTVRVWVEADGSFQVELPSPLRDMTPAQREKMWLSCLEARWLRGNLQAAALWGAHRRWAVEQIKGRAAQKVQHEHSGTVTVVNDLGRKPVVDIMPSYRTLKGKRGESDDGGGSSKRSAVGTPAVSGSHRDSPSK